MVSSSRRAARRHAPPSTSATSSASHSCRGRPPRRESLARDDAGDQVHGRAHVCDRRGQHASRAWLRASRASDADTRRRARRVPRPSARSPRAWRDCGGGLSATPRTANPRHASSPRTTTKATEPTTAMNETASASQTQVTRRMLAARGAVARRRRGRARSRSCSPRSPRTRRSASRSRPTGTRPWERAPDLGVEQALAVNVEEPLQRAFLAIPDAVEALNIFYFVGHFLLTGLFFVWLYRRSENTFATFRNGFFVATSIALIVHWQFPTAPPGWPTSGSSTPCARCRSRYRLTLERGALEPGLRRAVAPRGLRGRGRRRARPLREPALGARSSASSTRCSWC